MLVLWLQLIIYITARLLQLLFVVMQPRPTHGTHSANIIRRNDISSGSTHTHTLNKHPHLPLPDAPQPLATYSRGLSFGTLRLVFALAFALRLGLLKGLGSSEREIRAAADKDRCSPTLHNIVIHKYTCIYD